jgi:SAM-dependent methyltransferase
VKSILKNSLLYFYIKNFLTGGIPYYKWVIEFGVNKKGAKILDLGCGPADIMRFLKGDKPDYYYGVDISDEYLDTARKTLSELNIQNDIEVIDLSQLGHSEKINNYLIDKINLLQINKVLLIGVIHHLTDEAVLSTLELLSRCPTIQEIYTQDIVSDMNPINDFFVKLDRGEYIRQEAAYSELLLKSSWNIARQFWSNAGITSIKYIHFQLIK